MAVERAQLHGVGGAMAKIEQTRVVFGQRIDVRAGKMAFVVEALEGLTVVAQQAVPVTQIQVAAAV